MQVKVGITDDDFMFIIEAVKHYVLEHDLTPKELFLALNIIRKVGVLTGNDVDELDEMVGYW